MWTNRPKNSATIKEQCDPVLLFDTHSSQPPFCEAVQSAEMETQSAEAVELPQSAGAVELPKYVVTGRVHTGSESSHIYMKPEGSLSEQLVLFKEEAMRVLKDYITKNNIPNDVPDEPLEASSSDDDDEVKSKKTKLTSF